MASRSTFLTGHHYDSALNANSDTNRPSMSSVLSWWTRSPTSGVVRVAIGRTKDTNGTPGSRMLKQTSSCVLAPSHPLAYLKPYAGGRSAARALLEIRFENPLRRHNSSYPHWMSFANRHAPSRSGV